MVELNQNEISLIGGGTSEESDAAADSGLNDDTPEVMPKKSNAISASGCGFFCKSWAVAGKVFDVCNKISTVLVMFTLAKNIKNSHLCRRRKKTT